MNSRKFSSMRVYSLGRNYVLSSDFIKEKIEIRVINNTICVSSLSIDEWKQLTDSQTNSVMSPSFANVFTGYGCLGVLSTPLDQSQIYQQSALMQHYLIFVKDAQSVGTYRKFEFMKIIDIFVLPLIEDASSQNFNSVNFDFINDLKKLLCSGVFYFSLSNDPAVSFDITLSCQARSMSYQTNKKFLWNYNLHIPLRRLNLNTNQWLLKIICGYVEIRKIIIQAKVYRLGLISRLSTERVGARFHCRGINDHGNCANFVETEQFIYSCDTDEETSFLQLRGSVPVFFEQTGIQVGSHKLKICRSIQACYPAFERHIQFLLQEYGQNIFVLNLLGTKGDEEELSNFFHKLCQFSPFNELQKLMYINFDYHQEMKNNKLSLGFKLWKELIANFYKNNLFDGTFFYSKYMDGTDHYSTSSIKSQHKFIRTNCMDCLDRTNSVQSFISKEMLRYQLKNLIDSESEIRKFMDAIGQMWILNGDNISRTYAGTSAIQGRSVTKDFTTSLSRAFQNNFLDDNKHDSIDCFLYSMSRNYGNLSDRVDVLMSKTFLRLPYEVLKTIVSSKSKYTEKEKCRIMIGTWNINGGLKEYDMKQVDLNEWLIDAPLFARKTGFGHLAPSCDLTNFGEIDIFAIGFEEIVDLSAQNIVKASEENASIWRLKINEFLKKHGDYVELINENLQLVGVCLFVFVLKKHLGAIRDVSVSKSKTGFGGTAGNKGAVLLRFIYYNSSMCFVCSHFAAHQKEIKQRNEDFRQIYEQSTFSGQKGRSKIHVKNHDYIFWCGDLNYRIDLDNNYCRKLINEQRWHELLEADQLSIQRKEQNVFSKFLEAPICFPPTYKYNVCEDTYDRSEKCRVPAWTDRILWKRKIFAKEDENSLGKCLYYGRTDIRFSDHRPVSCYLEVEVDKVIPKRLVEELNNIFLSVHGFFQVVLTVSTHSNQMNENIKTELLNLFIQVPTYMFFKEFENNLLIFYSDAKHAYDALAQYNNYHLQIDDLTVQVKIQNEQEYFKLIEEELIDCLISLDYYKNNIRKKSIITEDVHVLDIFSNEAQENNKADSLTSYINVPSQLHSNVSIMNRMKDLNSQEYNLISIEADSKHLHLNPSLPSKPFSNSYSEELNNTFNKPKLFQSETNVIDLTNQYKSSSRIYPERPPPPVPPKPKSNEKPLIEISTDNGFDDDFNLLNINETQNFQKPQPPPLPPMPQKPIFSLFEDTFESLKFQTVQKLHSQPPLTSDKSIRKSSSPPPLPPLPAIRPAPSIPPKPDINKLYSNGLSSAINFQNVNKSSIYGSNQAPPLPPPPFSTEKPNTFQTPQISSDEFDDFFSKREKSSLNQTNNIIGTNAFDAFGNPFQNEETPLPPPRMNHFS